MRMLPKIRAWSARHSVFMRTACYAAMLVCVPLMLFSFNLTANGRKDILSAWEKHSASIAAFHGLALFHLGGADVPGIAGCIHAPLFAAEFSQPKHL